MDKEVEKDEDNDEASLIEFQSLLHDRYQAEKKGDEETSLRDRCLDLSMHVIDISHTLRKELKQFAMADQFLQCGANIGTNMTDAVSTQSGKDYLKKCEIVMMECLETRKWLELFYSSRFFALFQLEPMMAECDAIREMLSAICKAAGEKTASNA